MPNEPFRNISLVEIRQAVQNLATKKATGQDGIPAEIYRYVPTLIEHLQVLSNDILKSGNLPETLRTLYIVPLDKKGREPTL